MLVCSHVGLFPCGFVPMLVCSPCWFVPHVGLPPRWFVPMLVCPHVGLPPRWFVPNVGLFPMLVCPHVGLPPHALKGQKPLAQGSALGGSCAQGCRPVRAKASKHQANNKASALSGREATGVLSLSPACEPHAIVLFIFSSRYFPLLLLFRYFQFA